MTINEIISMRNSYKAIWTTNIDDFTIQNPSELNLNHNILNDLFNKFGFQFTQIDSKLFMNVENDNYHIIRLNGDDSYDYTMFTRIERHDDSCTYIRNSLRPHFSL